MNRRFAEKDTPADVAEALADCLARIEAGEDRDAVLARYLHLRDELVPLLDLAVEIRPVVSAGLPADARLRLRYALRGAVRARSRQRRRPAWRVRLLRLAMAAVAVLLLMSGGLATVTYSAPGTPLYPLGLAVREARLHLPLSPEERLRRELDLLEVQTTHLLAQLPSSGGDATPLFLLAGRTDDWLARYRAAPPPLAAALHGRALALVRDEQTLFRQAQDRMSPRRRAAMEALVALTSDWEEWLAAPPRRP
ncbi:MAG TPA: hypothetical protein EYH32_04530 [Anaerolineae bacterium]|nr:hypothetical protein [Anaerolineae bacterium]